MGPIEAEIISKAFVKTDDDQVLVEIKFGKNKRVLHWYSLNDARKLVAHLNAFDPDKPAENVGVARECLIRVKAKLIESQLKSGEAGQSAQDVQETINEIDNAESRIAEAENIIHKEGCKIYSNASDGTDCDCGAAEAENAKHYDTALVEELIKETEYVGVACRMECNTRHNDLPCNCDALERMERIKKIIAKLRGEHESESGT